MEGYDLFEFEGWTEEQNGDWVIKQEVLEDLKILYGDYYDDKYAMGIQNWDAFQVSFPSAVNESLSSTQIDDTLTKIKKENSLTPKQEAIIKEGLNAVGNYYYSESKTVLMHILMLCMAERLMDRILIMDQQMHQDF